MNYAFLEEQNIGFSHGRGFPPLNNAFLKEWNAVSPFNTVYLDILEKNFLYWVDRVHGHVDWNRNGIFEPAHEFVRAYANYHPNNSNGCEFTKYNETKVGNAETTTAPVMERLKDKIFQSNRLYLFYTKNGRVKYRYSTSSWDCPEPKKQGCAGGTWSDEKDAALEQSVGISAMNDLATIRLISVQFNGKIVEKKLSLIGGVEWWSTPKLLPGSAIGEPSLSFGVA